MKRTAIDNLKSALVFVGQAEEAVRPQSPLWKELGDLYEQLDSKIEELTEMGTEDASQS